jgi:small GTP-binding protein
MSASFSFDVFLSHNGKDKPRVLRLAKRLKKHGLRVWLDDWVIKPGDDIYLAVERGLEATRVLVLCLSPNALGSGWVGLERSTVLFRDPGNSQRRFLPVLLADCELPDTLRRYKYVDYRKDANSAFEELLGACRVPDEQDESQTASTKEPDGSKLLDRIGGAKSQTAPIVSPNRAKNGKRLAPESEKQRAQPEPLAVLARSLRGHTNWVNSVAVSPDGKWIASGSDDETVKIWDFNTGECITTLVEDTAGVNSVAITSDGNKVVSGASNGWIRIWDAKTWTLLKSSGETATIILSISAARNSETFLACGVLRGAGMALWSTATGGVEPVREISSGSMWSVAITGDAKRALSDSSDNSLTYWNLDTGECLATLKGHSDLIKSIAIAPNGRFAVSGSNDKTVKIWNLKKGTCVGTLEGHKSNIHSVAISPDGTLIASTGFTDGTVRLWDLQSGVCLQVIEDKWSGFAPVSVAFTPDGQWLVVGVADEDGQIYIFRLSGPRIEPPSESARRYVNAKVVLIGESTVGKTTLAHRLIDDRYIKTESTHGLNVWRIDLPLASEQGTEREALLWDFAGQEDYRLTHQLYLEGTALALLLINPQKSDPFAEAGDWLKALRTASLTSDDQRNIPKLLVPTRIDVGGMTVSERKIDRFLQEHGFSGCVPTSAKRGDNCSDKANNNQPSKLKQVIAQNIPWDNLPWTSTPRLLAEIKNAIVALRDETDIRLLRFAELVQRLEYALPKEKVGEADVRTAVTLLANYGVVRPLKFGDLVLLRWELLNGYAAAIIRAARAHKDEIGCVAEESIYGENFDFTGVERLKHRPDEELLLRALVQTLLDHSLCIKETEDGKTLLIFPSQYRRDRAIPKYPEIFVTYTFTGELQTIYTTLVVRLWYSHTFDHKELWQNAAEFTTSKGRTAGLVFERLGDGEGRLNIFFESGVPDELKVVFVEFIHRHLQKYSRDLRRERRYICASCGEPVKDMDAVRKRMKAGKDFITCVICDEPVPFNDHIEQRLSSDPVAKEVVAMDARATQELDTQALEQILTGHMQAICGEANQIFRELTKFDYGIDGEVEFKNDAGKASGKKIYVQLKSGSSYLRTRKTDEKEVFDVKDPRHLEYWMNQLADVYLVIRQTDKSGQEKIRWMNVTRYLKQRKDKKSRQIVFEGEKLDFEAVWRVRDEFFPQIRSGKKAGG